ncbi:MAG TPA: methyltransferase domain-containing protein [Bacteroidales bacterium]|nr:methyltransferase domain-containing protein [Bacteroidales bacterium]
MKEGHLDINQFLFPREKAFTDLHLLFCERNLRTILDVGGPSRAFNIFNIQNWIYRYSNITGSQKSHFIQDDICNSKIESDSFDLVCSNDMFEHILEPWLAAEHCVRICKSGGLLFHITLFYWDLHNSPIDCYRYSHIGLTHLFERTGKVKTINCGYYQHKKSKQRVIYFGEKI